MLRNVSGGWINAEESENSSTLININDLPFEIINVSGGFRAVIKETISGILEFALPYTSSASVSDINTIITYG